MFDLIFNSPKYLGIALALLGLLGGGLISWFVTFVYFKKGQSRRLLCFAVRQSAYLGYSSAEFHDLSVRYRDRHLTNPARYTVYVWNCGNVTLNNSDISKVDPLAFGHSSIEILETSTTWSTRESINSKVTIDASKSKLYSEFDFLDPGDGFAVEFLADRSPQTDRWVNIQVYGTVKGLNRTPFWVPAVFEAGSWWGTYAAFAGALFFGFCATALIYDAWVSGFVVTSFIKVLAAIIFGIIFVAIVGSISESFGQRSVVIPSLLRRPGDTKSDFSPVILEGSRRILVTRD